MMDDTTFPEGHNYWALPPGVEDRIHTTVEIRLTPTDKLRALFLPITVRIETDCEHAPGKVTSRSWVNVNRWVPPWLHMRGGIVEAMPEPYLDVSDKGEE